MVRNRAREGIKKTSDGPISLGSTIQLSGEFVGRKMVIDARILELEPNKKLVVEYLSGAFKGSKKIYVFEPEGEGRTRLTHASEGQFQGTWKVLEFLLKPMASRGFNKTNKEELGRISRSLESHR